MTNAPENDEHVSPPEELFPPKSGGMVHNARKQQEAEAAQVSQIGNAEGAPVDGSAFKAIRVRPESADIGNVRTITLSAQYPVARLLPADPMRRSAVILAVDAAVYVTNDEGLARDAGMNISTTQNQIGYFPAGIPLPIANQKEYWAIATTVAANTRITVIINKDSVV